MDVACGTGEHARLLSADFEIDGIDLELKFVEIARAENPDGNFSVADMRAFQLEKRYDVVQCLFSSIGYLLTPQDIVAALGRRSPMLPASGKSAQGILVAVLHDGGLTKKNFIFL